MQELNFESMGTGWSVLVDASDFKSESKQAILDYTADFDRRFSRFLPDSEANAFRDAVAGTYRISAEFASMLSAAEHLREVTDGHFDAAVGGLLERAGYGKKTSQNSESPQHYVMPKWSLNERDLTIDGSVVFDIGGIGKGYAIDGIAELLRKEGYGCFLVDGGGDMYATQKKDGAPWNIAVEYPGKPDTAAGTAQLENRGLAVSDVFRRRWGAWHHIVDPLSKAPVHAIIGCTALAPSAREADCATSALFLAEGARYGDIQNEFRAEYLVFLNDGTTLVSPEWPGELF